jgi:SAM-dependent methyltransferase
MDHQSQIDYYEGLLAKHGDSPLSLDWNSRESQRLRYQVLKELFIYGKKGAGVSVLDVGCGFGDLYGYFKAEGLLSRHKISYTGTDISPKILEVARKKYPDARFELKDILTDRQMPRFDYVFCSGALNIRTADREEHLEFVKEMIFRMWDLAAYGAAINFLGEGMLPVADQDDVNSGRYFFFSPELVLSYVRFVCGRYILRNDYHAGDFTVYMLK